MSDNLKRCEGKASVALNPEFHLSLVNTFTKANSKEMLGIHLTG